MTIVNLEKLSLNEFIGRDEPSQHCKATFPMLGAHGTEHSATVYFELEPGYQLGTHQDSAEELLLILEGSVEVVVKNERSILSKGDLVCVPKLHPHNLINVGATKAKVLGFFGGANHIVAKFEKTWLPTNSNIVDTTKVFS